MDNPSFKQQQACDTIVAAIQRLMTNRQTPVLAALDGGSGSGKSTLALSIGKTLQATVIPYDDFFAAHIPDAKWDTRTPEEKARDCMDWRRLRKEVLEPLLAGKPARWHAFDFEAGAKTDGSYAMRTDYVEREPTDVILLDGIYSTRPELTDLIDLSILIDVPVHIRHARLAMREDRRFLDAWHARWDAAETYYFTQIRPKASFDLVVTTG